MRQSDSAGWLEELQRKPRLVSLDPISVRFILSLRLVAAHRRVQGDPVPELAAKLGDITVAIHALALVETLARIWPDPIQVGRACCQCLTPDEATLGRALQAATERDRAGFTRQLEGLIRSPRIDLAWESAVSLVAAEYAAA